MSQRTHSQHREQNQPRGGKNRNNYPSQRGHLPAIPKMFQPKMLSVRIEAKNVPLIDTEKYRISDLVTSNERLNEAKSKLDGYYLRSKEDPAFNKTWIYFQSIIDLYKGMRDEFVKKANARHVTNASMKYHELYSHFELLPAKTAFFNAELPGAALCMFNHDMKTLHNTSFDWRASSLVPTSSHVGSTALGDVYGLWESNKSKWLMDVDAAGCKTHCNNGDATVLANIEDFAKKVGPGSVINGVELYSHDAGIDVSSDSNGALGFNDQEIANAKLHFGCALSGFKTLRVGGSFIAKQYTFFETFTWNLILIYSQMFTEFYICKPLTSRPYNSEIYLIGKGFLGLDQNINRVLSARLNNFNTNPLIPHDAVNVMFGSQLGDILRFSRMVFGQQTSFIEENVQLFEKYRSNLGALKAGLENLKAERIASWFKLYPVKMIGEDDQLASK